tara:strand:- start:36 stop:374 length:339 start_codon:yes stop_codon:yes gene_type:complete
MIQPGKLRYKTTISVPSLQQQTDFGDMAVDGGLSYTRFADIKWLPGSEIMSAEVLNLVKNVQFTYRYESITELIDRIDYINFDGSEFYIKSVEFRGQGNQQLVIIKAHTAKN